MKSFYGYPLYALCKIERKSHSILYVKIKNEKKKKTYRKM